MITSCWSAPPNEEFGQAVGADAHCRDAAEAATTAVRMVKASSWPGAERLTFTAVSSLYSGHRLRSPFRAGNRRLKMLTAGTISTFSVWTPSLHNRPGRFHDVSKTARERPPRQYDHRFVAYADCGTGGRLGCRP
ncbi:MAG: hypothetical protein CM15mP84_00550 [Cellvibrionales bacterium]|nr:MAG: hypothetical protein CM15mP84_00550 [Cellvibrionales bacterium]